MEPKVKIERGRENDELTKLTQKFFNDIQEYNKGKEGTPKEANITVIASDNNGGASFIVGDIEKISLELLTLVNRCEAFEHFLRDLVGKIQLIIGEDYEEKGIAN